MSSRGRVWTLGVSAAALFALAVPSGAPAATVGQHAPNSAVVGNCGGPLVFVTPGTGYVIPDDGALTSWTVRGDDSGANHQLKLKIVERRGGSTYRVVAEDPITRDIALNTLNTFEIEIPVQSGQRLALWAPSGVHPCDFLAPGADGTSWPNFDTLEPGIGDEFTVISTNSETQLNVSAELEEAQRCKGRRATISGTAGDDVLIGTPGKDVILGFAGRDKIRGLGAKDRLCGNNGKDKLKGGDGNDTLNGGPGRDKCIGGPGNDTAKKCEVERSI